MDRRSELSREVPQFAHLPYAQSCGESVSTSPDYAIIGIIARRADWRYRTFAALSLSGSWPQRLFVIAGND